MTHGVLILASAQAINPSVFSVPAHTVIPQSISVETFIFVYFSSEWFSSVEKKRKIRDKRQIISVYHGFSQEYKYREVRTRLVVL